MVIPIRSFFLPSFLFGQCQRKSGPPDGLARQPIPSPSAIRHGGSPRVWSKKDCQKLKPSKITHKKCYRPEFY
jgi:hypothetical protein